MARSVSEPEGGAGETVLTLAVLLQTGMAPAQAWRHLARSGDAAAGRVVAATARGTPLDEAVREAAGASSRPGPRRAPPRAEPWPEVAAAWQVAMTVGAPLAESLRALATALRDAQEADDEVRVALAEPASTARLVGWLPLVAVGLGALLGFDTPTALVGSPVGIACLVAGLSLILAAHRWTAALVRRASAPTGIPGLGAELFAIAMSGGVSLDRAGKVVRDATGRGPDTSTQAVLTLARSAGVPAVELLRASAALARHRARVDGRLRAARLSSRLLLPLGVCTLPAFLLLGVAPMMLGVLSSMPISL
jgi:tight adherence protein B